MLGIVGMFQDFGALLVQDFVHWESSAHISSRPYYENIKSDQINSENLAPDGYESFLHVSTYMHGMRRLHDILGSCQFYSVVRTIPSQGKIVGPSHHCPHTQIFHARSIY